MKRMGYAMPHRDPNFWSWVPFVLASGQIPQPDWNLSRIIEAVIIGLVSAGLSMFVAISIIQTQLTYISDELKEQKIEHAAQMNDLKTEIKDIRRDIYVPRNNKTIWKF